MVSEDLDTIGIDDYGVHVEYLGNVLSVLITRPTGADLFTLSRPDAIDLRDAITEWVERRP